MEGHSGKPLHSREKRLRRHVPDVGAQVDGRADVLSPLLDRNVPMQPKARTTQTDEIIISRTPKEVLAVLVADAGVSAWKSI